MSEDYFYLSKGEKMQIDTFVNTAFETYNNDEYKELHEEVMEKLSRLSKSNNIDAVKCVSYCFGKLFYNIMKGEYEYLYPNVLAFPVATYLFYSLFKDKNNNDIEPPTITAEQEKETEGKLYAQLADDIIELLKKHQNELNKEED